MGTWFGGLGSAQLMVVLDDLASFSNINDFIILIWLQEGVSGPETVTRAKDEK